VTLALGDPIPQAALPDTDGREHALGADGAPATVVVFTCNHCPYALAWHDRLLQVAEDYRDRGVRLLLVNPNDATTHPRDSLEAMQRRVADEGPWPAPYLRDERQDVARAFGARTTPDVFVFGPDGRLVYRGAPDADHGDPALGAKWLRDALEDTLAGGPVATPETQPVGCSVKWRPGAPRAGRA
jgi:peroxiredoxin